MNVCGAWSQRLLPKIQGTAMVDELVLLYRGMGQHDRALDVIVNEKKDFAEAKQYCLDNKPPHKHGDVPKSTFTDLLKIYFGSSDSACVHAAHFLVVTSCCLCADGTCGAGCKSRRC